MPIALFSYSTIFVDRAPGWTDDGLAVILSAATDGLLSSDEKAGLAIPEVNVTGPRMRRLNFDAIGLAVIDLAPEFLLTPAGRRLLDALGHLAQEQLTLGFIGPTMATCGAFLLDGVTAGLNLVPNTVVIPDINRVPDLRVLLEQLSQAGHRLLALDGEVVAVYTRADDRVEVTGDGQVLLAAFHTTRGSVQPNARVQILGEGMRRGWP